MLGDSWIFMGMPWIYVVLIHIYYYDILESYIHHTNNGSYGTAWDSWQRCKLIHHG